MRRFIISAGLPTLLVLLGLAVILILSGADAVGLTFGLTVAGVAGVLLVSLILYETARGETRYHTRNNRLYEGPHTDRF
jgi:hypothetical protein